MVYSSRVTVLVGHFGSGKTEIAINGALDLVRRGRSVALVDLDVVKPYFRSRSARALMAARGVTVVAPEGENAFADLPIIVPQVRSLLHDGDSRLILDAGGDATGARVLGSLLDAVPRAETDVLAVLNFRRPFTETLEAAVSMVREIEAAARMKVDGVISNTHLLDETTPEIVDEGYRLAGETARRLGVRLAAVAIDEATCGRVEPGGFTCPVVVLHRVVMPPFRISRERRRSGPLFVLN
jgi:hypothetical protein